MQFVIHKCRRPLEAYTKDTSYKKPVYDSITIDTYISEEEKDKFLHKLYVKEGEFMRKAYCANDDVAIVLSKESYLKLWKIAFQQTGGAQMLDKFIGYKLIPIPTENEDYLEFIKYKNMDMASVLFKAVKGNY